MGRKEIHIITKIGFIPTESTNNGLNIPPLAILGRGMPVFGRKKQPFSNNSTKKVCHILDNLCRILYNSVIVFY
jgi:hypothetical protein